MEYAIIIEKSKTGFGAYVPDLPGCVATARTRKGVESLIREAIVSHIDVMREYGEKIPRPTTRVAYAEVA